MLRIPHACLLLTLVVGGFLPVPAADSARLAVEPTIKDIRTGENHWYIRSTKLPGYAAATAHDPRFGEKDLWGSDVKASLFAKQVWPKNRVLVWAKPGTGAKDGWDAKHWLEDGKPATKGIDVDSRSGAAGHRERVRGQSDRWTEIPACGLPPPDYWHKCPGDWPFQHSRQRLDQGRW